MSIMESGYRFTETRAFTALSPVPEYSVYPANQHGGPPDGRYADRSGSRHRHTETFGLELDELEEALEGRTRVHERFFSSLGEAGDPELDDRRFGETTGFASRMSKVKRKVITFLRRILGHIRHRSTPEERMRGLRISWPVPPVTVTRGDPLNNDVSEERGRSRQRLPGGHRRENRSVSLRRHRSVD